MQTLLEKLNQDHIYENLSKLSLKDKKTLLSQIESFDVFSLFKQKKDFSSSSSIKSLLPWTKCSFSNEQDRKVGEEILKKGQVALVMLAGGQGTRFGFGQVKGCFPITPIKKKSLFQLFAEKIIAAQKKYQAVFPLAVMVSALNEEETISFFQKNQFFGLDSSNVYFFKQNLLPFLDEKGKWIFSSKNKIAMGPDGNGDLFYHLSRSGIWKKLRQKNIKYLSIFSVDNPLVNPFEESLIGHHKIHQNEVTLRAIEKEKNMGLLAENEGKLQIIEYLYFKDKKNLEKDFLFANANHFIVANPFVEKAQEKNKDLFYHSVKKRKVFSKKEKIIFKSEKFLFENFAFAEKVGAVLYPQKECFSPLKNNDDICCVEKDLLGRDKQILLDLGVNKSLFKKKFELSQDFHFPTQSLKEKCKKTLYPIEGYIQETDLV